MYISFPLAGFDTSESATHLPPIYLRSCEKNNIGTNVTSENQLLQKELSYDYFINPYEKSAIAKTSLWSKTDIPNLKMK